jgi:hypothetical protein
MQSRIASNGCAIQTMKTRHNIVISAALALALLPAYAFGAPPFPRAVKALHIEDGGVYSTDWTVYPLRVERTATSSQKPEEMILGVFQDGKEGGFQGIVQISCDQPIDSYVTTGRNGLQQFDDISLKDMMKIEVFPRKLVANIFALFCTGSSLKAADLNMSRD